MPSIQKQKYTEVLQSSKKMWHQRHEENTAAAEKAKSGIFYQLLFYYLFIIYCYFYFIGLHKFQLRNRKEGRRKQMKEMI